MIFHDYNTKKKDSLNTCKWNVVELKMIIWDNLLYRFWHLNGCVNLNEIGNYILTRRDLYYYYRRDRITMNIVVIINKRISRNDFPEWINAIIDAVIFVHFNFN